MQELNVRILNENDWDTLCKWWEKWPDWVNPPKSFLPNNGTGGLMVEKNKKPIIAGFIYLTNSDAVLLEWIVSDPDYREKDRKDALKLLITSAENACKELGKKHMFTIGRNTNLINTHKELGWTVDNSSSYEITKNI